MTTERLQTKFAKAKTASRGDCSCSRSCRVYVLQHLHYTVEMAPAQEPNELDVKEPEQVRGENKQTPP